ncbi:MAG: hypothetical protein K8R76_08935 [Candidatus Aegiribacteria sp.]|nr:hypothetical protein [Candidatus Aegiribacteria sp.]
MTLAIGSFDGIHMGHEVVIRAALLKDRNAGVVCFEPVPRQYFGKGSWSRRLTTSFERAKILRELGIKKILLYPFDNITVNMEPEVFLEDLYAREQFSRLVVGYDFHFGRERKGTEHFLKQWCTSRRIDTIIVPPLKTGDVPVKSERIRNLLENGDVRQAELLLGRKYSVTGVVSRGKGVGRRLGFPTVNVRVPFCKLLPERGSYAGIVTLDESDRRMPAAVFVPGNATGPVEAHLINRIENMYGCGMTVSFCSRLRGIASPDSMGELSDLIAEDVRDVKKLAEEEKWMEDPER